LNVKLNIDKEKKTLQWRYMEYIHKDKAKIYKDIAEKQFISFS
jgi:hypothetical protein